MIIYKTNLRLLTFFAPVCRNLTFDLKITMDKKHKK